MYVQINKSNYTPKTSRGVKVQNNVDFYISVFIFLFLKFILGHKTKKITVV